MEKEKKKVLFVSQEIAPYLPETEMSVVCRHLPQGIQEKGREIRTFMPRYEGVNERRNQLHEVIRLSGMNLVIEDTDHPLIIKVASIQSARLQVYFIDNEDFFMRPGTLRSDDGLPFPDNDQRAIFFARGVLETVIKLRWAPDIIHCHGWIASLVPYYVKSHYAVNPLFRDAKIILSIYKEDLDGFLHQNIKNNILAEGTDPAELALLDEPTYLNMSKFAIKYSDAIIQGSPEIHPELAEYIRATEKDMLPFKSKEEMVVEYDGFYSKYYGNN
ncbi:MAG: glycogen/starch synthase [Bacteroidales bacterium]|jgi:starch synthase|nr:glycogen/starch synthase [Bacteroidales bacterium]